MYSLKHCGTYNTRDWNNTEGWRCGSVLTLTYKYLTKFLTRHCVEVVRAWTTFDLRWCEPLCRSRQDVNDFFFMCSHIEWVKNWVSGFVYCSLRTLNHNSLIKLSITMNESSIAIPLFISHTNNVTSHFTSLSFLCIAENYGELQIGA